MAKVTIGGRSYDVEVRGDSVVVDGQEFPVTIRNDGAHFTVNAGGIGYRVQLPPAAERASGMAVQVDYRPFTVEFEGRLGGGAAPARARSTAPAAAAAPAAAVKGAVVAPIAGKVLKVLVKQGAAVARGEVLLILEAMKMENEVKSPADGTVTAVHAVAGAKVGEGETLVVVG